MCCYSKLKDLDYGQWLSCGVPHIQGETSKKKKKERKIKSKQTKSDSYHVVLLQYLVKSKEKKNSMSSGTHSFLTTVNSHEADDLIERNYPHHAERDPTSDFID